MIDPIAEAKAKLAEIAAKREARATEQAKARELELALRELSDAEAVEKAECEYGASYAYGEPPNGRKIATVDTDMGVVIVKRPNHVIFKRFQDSGASSTAEIERLVKPSLVHPSSAVFDRWLEDQPAILLRVAGACAELAGVRMREIAGK